MNLKAILEYTRKPDLYAKGTHFMWNDPYISQQLQQIHLDPEMDLASRKPESIERTIQWILENAPYSNLNPSHKEPLRDQTSVNTLDILELGCGPGLYTQRFAEMGHRVSGLDISETSIATAEKRAAQKKLDISYKAGNYLNTDLGREQYDLIFIVFCDFGVLNPGEQKQLLQTIYRALKPGGVFLFDVLRNIRTEEKRGMRNWEISEQGFWSSEPSLVLHDSIPYPTDKAVLEQHLVILEKELRCYRFWSRFYSESDIKALLEPAGYMELSFSVDVLAEDGLWNGDNVLFCKGMK